MVEIWSRTYYRHMKLSLSIVDVDALIFGIDALIFDALIFDVDALIFDTLMC